MGEIAFHVLGYAHSKDVSKSEYDTIIIRFKRTHSKIHTHTRTSTSQTHTWNVDWERNAVTMWKWKHKRTEQSWMYKATAACCIIVKMLSNHRTENYFIKRHTGNHMRNMSWLEWVNCVHTLLSYWHLHKSIHHTFSWTQPKKNSNNSNIVSHNLMVCASSFT